MSSTRFRPGGPVPRVAALTCRRRLRDLDGLGRTISKPYAPEETR